MPAPPIEKIVLSASRRTDIPAFYMDWFMERIEKGTFQVVNPYNRRVSTVSAAPEAVHTIVFWSKQFGPFLKGNYGKRLKEKGYHLYFSFTINSTDLLLEPNLPPLTDRLDQLTMLCERFGPQAVDWRFDPICFYRKDDGGICNTLGDFERIAAAAGSCGVRRCITSFMDHYRKIERRVKSLNGFRFLDPALEEKKAVLVNLNRILQAGGLTLFLCCEKQLLASLPASAGIRQSACIPNHRLKQLYGGTLSMDPDRGQRTGAGCGCRVSFDIGCYDLHPCPHNCLFCYANPARWSRRGQA